MIKFYCERCGDYQEFIIEPFTCKMDKGYGYDILCKKCKIGVSGFIVNEPGEYIITKKENKDV